MVIFNVCSRSKWLIPRAKTLLWHAQNTKDHCLTQSWAGVMTVQSFYFFSDALRFLYSAVVGGGVGGISMANWLLRMAGALNKNHM